MDKFTPLLLSVLLAGCNIEGANTHSTAPRPTPPANIEALDSFLTASEAEVPGVLSGASKKIVWATEPSVASDVAIIYLHGYSSSRQEIDPVPQLVAKELNANLFYTRFKGHGIEGGHDSFKGVTFDDWLADAEEALAIGRTLGRKVIIMAHSNGAAIATFLVQAHQHEGDLVATLFVAPNYQPKNKKSTMLANPIGAMMGRWIYGGYYGSADEPTIIPESSYPHIWSNSQHMDATIALAVGIKRLQKINFENLTVPLFIVASDFDKVVSTPHTHQVFARYGNLHPIQKELLILNNTSTPGEHTITGNAKAPSTVETVTSSMVQFVQRVLN